MKVGDLVRGLTFVPHDIGIVTSEPLLSTSCKPEQRHTLHDFLPESYHIVKVTFLTSSGVETIDCFLDELEVISEGR